MCTLFKGDSKAHSAGLSDAPCVVGSYRALSSILLPAKQDYQTALRWVRADSAQAGQRIVDGEKVIRHKVGYIRLLE